MNQTPLFQLNLILWLTWPAPHGEIRPVLHDEGFTLKSIGPSFETPLELRARAGQVGMFLKGQVSPDVLLEHTRLRLLVPVECKVSSFGPDAPPGDKKHQSHQATALLALTGPFLADYLGLTTATDWRTHLLYAVGGGHEGPMQTTLERLKSRLREVGIATASGAAFGIYIRGDGIYLRAAAPAVTPIAALRTAPPDGIRVVRLDEDEEPRMLYLLPWDPSIGPLDEYEKRVLEERVRTTLVSLIGDRLDTGDFEISLDEILRAAVEVWDLWRDRRAAAGFRNAVRAYVRQVMRQLSKMGAQIEVRQGRFAFSRITPEVAQRIRRYFISTSFRRGEIDLWSEAIQLDFDSLPVEW